MSIEYFDTSAISLPASAAIARWRVVDVQSDGTVQQSSGNGGRGIGVSQQPVLAEPANPSTTGFQACPILLFGGGVSMCEAGAAVAQGATVGCDNVGRVVDGTGVGVALEAAGAAGVIIAVALVPANAITTS